MNSLERIERYANAQTPLVGIPYFSVADGRYRTAVFRRQHLEAALSAPVERAKYDEATHHLVLNGGRSTYRLRDLAQPVQDNGGVGYYQHWQLRDELSKWAATKRKRVAAANDLERTQSRRARGAARCAAAGAHVWRAACSVGVSMRAAVLLRVRIHEKP